MKMTWMQHFAELRRRVLWTALVFAIGFCIGWVAAPWLQEFLTAPLMSVWPGGEMLYTGLTDGLMITFSLATGVGILAAAPAALWHIWAFVAPGLHANEKKIIWPIMLMSPVLFIIGAAFAFYILFPVAFKFFVDLNTSAPVPSVLMPAARDYLVFAIGLLKVFGIAFQLPLVLIILNRVGVLSRTTARRMRRYAIVGIVVVAAILTPPDIVSQIILAVPMWALFEISLMFMRPDSR